VNGRTGPCYETLGSGGLSPTGPEYPAGADIAAQKFTGKERDAETGLDYFGARYFSAAQGRFTSPDWSERPQAVPYANPSDPQTLNLYAYVRNNPLCCSDIDGHVDWAGAWQAIKDAGKSLSVKVSAGLGLEESIGIKGKLKISAGGSATGFFSYSSKGLNAGSDLEYGAAIELPSGKKLGPGHTTGTLSKENGVDLPPPGKTTEENDFGVGAVTNSKETLAIGDQTAAGPALGFELDIDKGGFMDAMKDLGKALTAPTDRKGAPPEKVPEPACTSKTIC
jgi:RHS repeat-associated protein